MSSLSKFYKIMLYVYLRINGQIRLEICTCHDSSAVVACANFWPDQTISFKSRANQVLIQLWAHNPLVKWIPEQCFGAKMAISDTRCRSCELNNMSRDTASKAATIDPLMAWCQVLPGHTMRRPHRGYQATSRNTCRSFVFTPSSFGDMLSHFL